MADYDLVKLPGDPPRFEVREGGAPRGIMTLGAFSAVMSGPMRTLQEGGAPTVVHDKWVRCLPGPFDGRLDPRWFRLAMQANEDGVPDALGLALEYVAGAAAVMLGDLRIGGDALYGSIVQGETQPEEGSDFNDFLGLRWVYPNGEAGAAEARRLGCLDCSGFMRMVWGYREQLPGAGYPSRIPLAAGPTHDRSALPRRAHQILRDGPGVVVVFNNQTQVVLDTNDPHPLQEGDLVFFDADSGDGPLIDHVGMYLGRDSNQDLRFISSRKTQNVGPTMADFAPRPSLLNGSHRYAKSFRAIRRL